MSSLVAGFISHATFGDLSPEAVHGAKRSLTDCVGVMLAGSQEELVGIACEPFRPYDTKKGAMVWGRSLTLEPSTAAMINGISAHALDYDDSSETMYGHPSASVVPACLAIASIRPATGRELLLAYAVGVEVESKMMLAFSQHYDWGWHSSSTLGALGAAAACAKLLGLDRTGVARALGIAASLASGFKQNFGTMTKPLHLGNAARNGVLAALLAEGGFTADDDAALNGPQGFLKVFSGGGEHDLQRVCDALGKPWEVEDPGIRVKLYPCCTSNHRSVDAAIFLANKFDLNPDDIKKVECGVPWRELEILIRPNPQVGVEATFSIQYCVARALVSRELTLSHFDTPQVLDPAVRPLMKRVSMYVHPEGQKHTLTRELAEVFITMKDERVLSKKVYEQEGHPSRPLSDEQVRRKFSKCASRALAGNRVEALLDLCWDIERLTDTGNFLSLLASAR